MSSMVDGLVRLTHGIRAWRERGAVPAGTHSAMSMLLDRRADRDAARLAQRTPPPSRLRDVVVLGGRDALAGGSSGRS